MFHLSYTPPSTFLHSWLIAGFLARLTWRVQLVEQELITLPEHLSSPPDFSGVRVTRSLVLCVGRFLSLIVLAIELSVLQFTTSGYPFGIFKLFLCKSYVPLWVCISTYCSYWNVWKFYVSILFQPHISEFF